MSDTRTKQQLLHARELIRANRLADARIVLNNLPHDPIAQKWIAKLDAIEAANGESLDAGYDSAPAVRSTDDAFASLRMGASGARVPRPAAQPTSQSDPTTRMLRYLVSGVVMVMGVVMIVGFFLFPWMNLGDMSFFGMSMGAFAETFSMGLGGAAEMDTGPLEVTAMELWMGTNDGENFTMDLTKADGGGIADVRLLDRFLILLPVLALVMIWFAWNYASEAGSPLAAVSLAAGLALMLLLFPLAWEELSEQALEDDINASMSAEMSAEDQAALEEMGDLGMEFGNLFGNLLSFKDAYSTGEQQLMGGIAFVACLLGLVVEVMSAAQPKKQSTEAV